MLTKSLIKNEFNIQILREGMQIQCEFFEYYSYVSTIVCLNT
jgi:hypothetical protein